MPHCLGLLLLVFPDLRFAQHESSQDFHLGLVFVPDSCELYAIIFFKYEDLQIILLTNCPVSAHVRLKLEQIDGDRPTELKLHVLIVIGSGSLENTHLKLMSFSHLCLLRYV